LKFLYWIVVQSSCPSANKEISNLISEAEPDFDLAPGEKAKVTWEDFFFSDKNKSLHYLEGCIKRNRSRITAQFANAIELQHPKSNEIHFDLDLDASDNKQNSNAYIFSLKPTVSTTTNYVAMFNKTPVYRSGATDPSVITNQEGGLIFNENPFLGPTILTGPPNNNTLFGKTWLASDESLNSFPVWSGRVKDTPSMKKYYEKNQYSVDKSISIDKFVWEKGDVNYRLLTDVYRPRNHQFKQIEKSLGYHNYAELHLQPIVVKIASCKN